MASRNGKFHPILFRSEAGSGLRLGRLGVFSGFERWTSEHVGVWGLAVQQGSLA